MFRNLDALKQVVFLVGIHQHQADINLHLRITSNIQNLVNLLVS